MSRGILRAAAAALLVAATVACGGSAGAGQADNGAFLDAYHAGRPAEVTVSGTVSRVDPDVPSGRDGAHERFDVEISGVVVEVDHNLSLAPRVPVRAGVTVLIHGQFEPDPGHPVIHYTHHATGRHEGGWIDLDGRRYD